mmetsp:Transcript_37196/g.68896  ORF Transcript_37196/g.68896 Transcript_37196/m.68896 type:complete len:232 (-) Transcript_37196:1081-1776(-)
MGRPHIRKRRWQEGDQRPGPPVVVVVVVIPSQSMRELDRNVQRRLRLRQRTVQHVVPSEHRAVVRVESEDATESMHDSFRLVVFVDIVADDAGEGQRSHSVMLQSYPSGRVGCPLRRRFHPVDGTFEMSSVFLGEPVEIIPRMTPAMGIVDISPIVPHLRKFQSALEMIPRRGPATVVAAVHLQDFQSALLQHSLEQHPPHAVRKSRHLSPAQVSPYVIHQSQSFQRDILF